MRRRAGVIAIVACACAAPTSAPAPAPIVTPIAIADAQRAVTPDANAFASAFDAGLDAAPRIGGKLRKATPSAGLWPSRVCTAGHALVFEDDCGCGDALLCDVKSAAAPTLAIALRTDPSRMRACDDCYPMVPGRCALPALAAGTWTVQINGAPAFDLVVGADGSIADATCWN